MRCTDIQRGVAETGGSIGMLNGGRFIVSQYAHQTFHSSENRVKGSLCVNHTMADNVQRPRPPPNRRRDKKQLSCDPCKHRKYLLDSHQNVLCTQLYQAKMRSTTPMRGLFKAWSYQLLHLCNDVCFCDSLILNPRYSEVRCSATAH